jgi:catechol 2,3-dioxygenase-like lactoylglutathione lyase family enzyme
VLVDDVDVHHERARAGGATITFEIADQAWGHRMYRRSRRTRVGFRVADRTGSERMTKAGKPVATYGLTHVALAVADPQRSFRFYRDLLGAKLLADLEGREDDDLSDRDWIEFGVPGAQDVITLKRAEQPVTGETGDLVHFGFRLVSEEDPDAVAKVVERAGGTLLGAGRFTNGGPYVFAKDPDGYEIELWFEEQAAWRR